MSYRKLQYQQKEKLYRIQINGLQVLHRAIRILQDQRLSIKEWLYELVRILPFAWQFPEIAAARIQMGNAEILSSGFVKTKWVQSAKFQLANGQKGVIEIVYLQERADEFEGPFLKEERAFLDSIAEIISSAIERRIVEDALREKEIALRSSNEHILHLAGRLIEAQETERSRIARELHDGLNQQIAAAAISLSNIRRRLAKLGDETPQELALLQKMLLEIGDEIRHVSHELHPGILQHTGLAGAIRSVCSEFLEQKRIQMDVKIEGDVDAIPLKLAVCIYRVVQEALHNIGRHSGATGVRVFLNKKHGMLKLKIADNGCGFLLNEAAKNGGLGLISMDERVRIFHGILTIKTKPQQGTLLQLVIPRTDT
jgi:signal transduction histidine kinase